MTRTWKFIKGTGLAILLTPFSANRALAESTYNETNQDPGFWIWLLFIAIAAFIIALGLPAIRKWQRKRREKTLHIEIKNIGNIHSRYSLRTTEPTENLTFTFLLNSVKLHEQPVPIPGAIATVTRTVQTETTGIRQAAPSTPQPQIAASAGPQKGKQKPKKKKGGVGFSFMTRSAGILASLMTTLGTILPGAAGSSLVRISAKLRMGQSTAMRVKTVGSYASQLTPGTGAGARPSNTYNQPSAYATTTSYNRPVQPIAQPTAIAAVKEVPSHMVEIWAQTPFVEAGQVMHLDLSVTPINPFKTQHYPLTIKSRSVELLDAPLVVEESSLQIAGLNIFELYAPYLLLTTSIIVLLIFFLSLW